jgi:2-dehydro-3-deoxyphosphooctonate aldolase (KDO 8-P synthase)
VGVDALFLEVHPNPPEAKSDAAAQLDITEAEAVLEQVARIREAVAGI